MWFYNTMYQAVFPLFTSFQVRKPVKHLSLKKKKKSDSKHTAFRNVVCTIFDQLMNQNMWIFTFGGCVACEIIYWGRRYCFSVTFISTSNGTWHLFFLLLLLISGSEEILTEFNNSECQGEIMVTVKWVTTLSLIAVTSLQLISSFTLFQSIRTYHLMYT